MCAVERYRGEMTITVSVPDQLGQQAAAQGLSVEAYVEELARQAVQSKLPSQKPKRTAAEAVAHLRETRKGVTLAGLEIKDLVAEAASIEQRFCALCFDHPSMVFSGCSYSLDRAALESRGCR